MAADGGVMQVDAGLPMGTVGPGGGTVSRLYFAIVGDTRPASEPTSTSDPTQGYPTQIIQKIYADIAAMNPQPQFVLTTGDYMFANPYTSEGAAQLALYTAAQQQYRGTAFSVMGNHECTGGVSSNCASQPTQSYQAFLSALVTPLGKSKPYYTIPINATDGSWTAKLILTACNAWDSTQSSWLAGELARQTTYTFVSRHEPSTATNAPCVTEMDNLLGQHPYDLLLVGHTHTFAHYQKEIVVGNGGAPLTGSVNYGYATVEQQPTGHFKITLYDFMTALPVSSFVQ
jgi:hypothetical protein